MIQFILSYKKFHSAPCSSLSATTRVRCFLTGPRAGRTTEQPSGAPGRSHGRNARVPVSQRGDSTLQPGKHCPTLPVLRPPWSSNANQHPPRTEQGIPRASTNHKGEHRASHRGTPGQLTQPCAQHCCGVGPEQVPLDSMSLNSGSNPLDTTGKRTAVTVQRGWGRPKKTFHLSPSSGLGVRRIPLVPDRTTGGLLLGTWVRGGTGLPPGAAEPAS